MGSVLDSRRLFASAAFASALLTLILVLTPPPQSAPPSELLSQFRAHQTQLLASATAVLAWVIASVLLVVALGRFVAGDRPTAAFAATLLCSGGILLLGFGTFLSLGVFFAIAAANEAIADSAQANFHALVWRNLSFMLSDPGLMVLGSGQMLFGWLTWKQRTLPRYVATVLLLGGVAGLLTLAVYQTRALAFVQLVAFAVGGAACGWHLTRSAGARVPTPTEAGAQID